MLMTASRRLVLKQVDIDVGMDQYLLIPLLVE